MGNFGLDWREAERQHESVSTIKSYLKRLALTEEDKIVQKEDQEAHEATARLAAELASGMRGPLKEEKRVEAMQRKAAETVLKVRSEGHKHDERVVDSVRRKQRRLKQQMMATEQAIMKEAIQQEKAVENKARQEAYMLRN